MSIPASSGFHREAYWRRNVGERLVGRLKEFRRVPIRYEKSAVHVKALIILPMIVILLRLFT